MTDATLYRTGAVFFGASGAINIVADLLPGTAILNLAGVAAGILGLPAVYLFARHTTGRAGLVTALLAAVGLIGIAGFLFADAAILANLPPETVTELTEGPAGMAIFAAVILYVAGVLAFAAVNWRGGVLPRPALALWALGTAPTAAAIALPPLFMTVAEAAAGAGVVWVALGIHRQVSQAAQAAERPP